MPEFERNINRRNYCTKMNHVRKFTKDTHVIREDTNNQMQEIYFLTDCKRVRDKRPLAILLDTE